MTQAAVKERGIIFNMVKAILEGRKTQTRRVIKPQPSPDENISVGFYHPALIDKDGEQYPGDEVFGAFTEDGEYAWICPYGQVGDRLWVRETTWVSDCGKYHCYLEQASGDVISETIRYTRDKDNPFQIFGFSVLSHSSPDKKGYAFKRWFGKVDLNRDPWTDVDFVLTTTEAQFHKKQPSIYMPRWASRIDLEITDLRAERLQEIKLEDCWDEGIRGRAESRVYQFKQLWNSLINKKYPYNWEHTWEANPWVWIISFKVLNTPC